MSLFRWRWSLVLATCVWIGCGQSDPRPEGVDDTPDGHAGVPGANGGGGGGRGGQGGQGPLSTVDAEGSGPSPDARPSDSATATDGAKGAGDAGISGDGGRAAQETDYLGKVVPVLLIDVAGKAIPSGGAKVQGTFKVVEDHDGTLTGIDKAPASVEAHLEIGIRGNSSASWYAQKPYGFEIHDDKGANLALSLLGLPKESDFVLHSCYSDKTCMRDALAYDLARALGAPASRWAPRTRYVEVYIDSKYQGLYLLVEKIKRDKNRVAIPEPAATAAAGDITGGYIWSLERDRNKGATKSFQDALTPGVWWAYRSPSDKNITAEQRTYLQGAVAKFVRAIDANPKWSEVKKLIDVPSWLDYMLMEELANNGDGFSYSWYFYKLPDAQGGKVFMAPWDFDLGFGNIDYGLHYCSNTSLIAVASLRPFKALFADPALADDLRCRYQELRRPGGPLDIDRMESLLDAFAQHVSKAKARDQAKWANIGKPVWPNNYVGSSWNDEVRYLKFWLRRRLSFLDDKLPGSCPAGPKPPAVMPSTIAAPVKETAPRAVLCCNQATVYIPIEGPVPPAQMTYACPP